MLVCDIIDVLTACKEGRKIERYCWGGVKDNGTWQEETCLICDFGFSLYRPTNEISHVLYDHTRLNKMIDLLKMYQKGEKVEQLNAGEWEVTLNPSFNFATIRYRIKGKPETEV